MLFNTMQTGLEHLPVKTVYLPLCNRWLNIWRRKTRVLDADPVVRKRIMLRLLLARAYGDQARQQSAEVAISEKDHANAPSSE